MKNIKTQQEVKAIEEMVMKATGMKNVELVLPVSMRELPSVDYRLLEMENKQNVARNRMTPRQARQEAKVAARKGVLNKVRQAVDSALDVVEEPKKLLNIKPVGAVANYFFLLDEEEEVVEAPPVASPTKEGKLVVVKFNK